MGEVLGALAAGLTSPEIAGRWYRSEHTVNDHVKAVLGRTGRGTVSSCTAGSSVPVEMTG